ncbi:hypothetical protein EDC01DRAFT_636955 [Geopyxis carbonaria]|nr:hypothetical protein EDC01DRAFT_636955 [Geopyxis carbonaria]
MSTTTYDLTGLTHALQHVRVSRTQLEHLCGRPVAELQQDPYFIVAGALGALMLLHVAYRVVRYLVAPAPAPAPACAWRPVLCEEKRGASYWGTGYGYGAGIPVAELGEARGRCGFGGDVVAEK